MNRANLLSQIIFNAPNYIFWKDTYLIYRGCNLNFAKLAGMDTPEKIIGKTDDEMPWGHFTGHIYKEEDKQIMRTGMPILNKEVPLYLSENMQKMVLSVSKVPLFDETKKIIGIMGIFIDTTDRILAEEREKAAILASAESKAEVEKQLRQAVMILTGSIVHDLRTPLLILESSSSFLGKNMPILIESYDKATRHGLLEDTAPIHKAMKGHLLKIDQEIKKTVRDMHEFIDSTLQTLSKVISNDISQDDLTVCSMWHCIHNTLLRYPFTDEQRHLVEWDQQDFKFMGNELMIIRVLFNLIKNSLEQIEKNQGGKIIISTESNEKENIIRFKDTAGGAPPEVIERLFAGYQTTKEKGTGIGLAFCRIAIESFGGGITCQSVHGEYIEFIINFPRVLCD